MKKIVIVGSAKLQDEISFWKSFFIDKNYEILDYPKPIEEEKINIDDKNASELPAKSRILFAEDGIEKIQSIDNTLKQYGNLTAVELVNLTHKKNTPWYLTPKKRLSMISKIEDEIILKNHCNEVL